MKNLTLLLSVLLLSSSAFSGSYIAYSSQFKGEVEISDGGTSGVLELTLPVVDTDGDTSIQSYTYFDLDSLGSDYVRMFNYICAGGKAIMFKSHAQSVTQNSMRVGSFFASGAVLDNLFYQGFSWLIPYSGVDFAGDARRFACRPDVLANLNSLLLENLDGTVTDNGYQFKLVDPLWGHEYLEISWGDETKEEKSHQDQWSYQSHDR